MPKLYVADNHLRNSEAKPKESTPGFLENHLEFIVWSIGRGSCSNRFEKSFRKIRKKLRTCTVRQRSNVHVVIRSMHSHPSAT